MLPSSANAYHAVGAQLLRESVAMTRYLLSSGAGVPGDLVREVERHESAAGALPDVGPLSAAHGRLAKLVSPARPGSVVYLGEVSASSTSRNILGTIPLVRQILGVALVCLALFISLSLFQYVDAEPNVSVVDSDALRVFLGEIFWMSAAGLGASFAILFQVNELIAARRFEPSDAPSHWIKLALGVIAGFILVALIPLEGVDGRGAQVMAKPTLAMLGGFSASAVYLILNRLVDSVESVFRPDEKTQAAAQRRAETAQREQEASESRMAVAGRLMAVQQKLASGATTEAAAAELRELVGSLLPTGSDDIAGPAAGMPEEPSKVPALSIVRSPGAGRAAS